MSTYHTAGPPPESERSRVSDQPNTLYLQLELERMRSHERHMRHIYGLRWGGLALAGLTIAIGAAMTFKGLEGSFTWAIEVPRSIGAKLTNASPGIVFATVGLILGFFVIRQAPVNYTMTDASSYITLGGDARKPRRRR